MKEQSKAEWAQKLGLMQELGLAEKEVDELLEKRESLMGKIMVPVATNGEDGEGGMGSNWQDGDEADAVRKSFSAIIDRLCHCARLAEKIDPSFFGKDRAYEICKVVSAGDHAILFLVEGNWVCPLRIDIQYQGQGVFRFTNRYEDMQVPEPDESPVTWMLGRKNSDLLEMDAASSELGYEHGSFPVLIEIIKGFIFANDWLLKNVRLNHFRALRQGTCHNKWHTEKAGEIMWPKKGDV